MFLSQMGLGIDRDREIAVDYPLMSSIPLICVMPGLDPSVVHERRLVNTRSIGYCKNEKLMLICM
jgi:hypothetical protein